MNVTGFVVYFSDRRGNRNFGADGAAGRRRRIRRSRDRARLGFEDFINTDAQSTSNGALDAGEDVNGNGVLDVYGARRGCRSSTASRWCRHGIDIHACSSLGSPRAPPFVARVNPPFFFRRALKLVNGARGQLPANGLQGLTVATENPVIRAGQLQRRRRRGFGAARAMGHVSAAIVADAVTLLSNSWNDIRSFTSPHLDGQPGCDDHLVPPWASSRARASTSRARPTTRTTTPTSAPTEAPTISSATSRIGAARP